MDKLELSTDFLTNILKNARLININSEVKAFQIEELSYRNNAEGYLSKIIRINLTYLDDLQIYAPKSIILKSETNNLNLRQWGRERSVFKNEIYFYNHIASISPIFVPKCLFSKFDESNQEGLLIFEDVGNLKGGNDIAGITFEEAIDTVKSIAPLHARWWKKEMLHTIPINSHRYMIASQFSKLYGIFKQSHSSYLTKEIKDFMEEVCKKVFFLIESAKKRPMSLVHGDLRADNLRFQKERFSKVIILDWQLITKGLAAFDIARLGGGSILLKNKDEHSLLCEKWHETLLENGVQDYSFQEAIDDYYLGMLLALHLPLANAEFYHSQDSHAGKLLKKMIERYFYTISSLSLKTYLEKLPH